jgi:uncharacterized membrane protein
MMQTKQYSCVRRGGDYIVVETGPAETTKRILATGIGTAMLWDGLRRRGILGALTTLAGAALCARGYTGIPFKQMLWGNESGKDSVPERSSQSEANSVDQPAQDAIEQASVESFPASDPPATRAGSVQGADPLLSSRLEGLTE